MSQNMKRTWKRLIRLKVTNYYICRNKLDISLPSVTCSMFQRFSDVKSTICINKTFSKFIVIVSRLLEWTFIEIFEKIWHLWESDFHPRVWDSNNFHLRNKLSAIPNSSSERFVQIEEGPFCFPEFNLLRNALLLPRPRPTASTLADRIKT